METDVWTDELSDVYASYISVVKIIVLFQHSHLKTVCTKQTQMV
jgi:hypothetical protein